MEQTQFEKVNGYCLKYTKQYSHGHHKFDVSVELGKLLFNPNGYRCNLITIVVVGAEQPFITKEVHADSETFKAMEACIEEAKAKISDNTIKESVLEKQLIAHGFKMEMK